MRSGALTALVSPGEGEVLGGRVGCRRQAVLELLTSLQRKRSRWKERNIHLAANRWDIYFSGGNMLPWRPNLCKLRKFFGVFGVDVSEMPSRQRLTFPVTASLCENAPHHPLESLVPTPTPSPAAPHLPPPETCRDVHPSAHAPPVNAGQSRPDILSHSSARAIPGGIY